jgi:hypothetical protein
MTRHLPGSSFSAPIPVAADLIPMEAARPGGWHRPGPADRDWTAGVCTRCHTATDVLAAIDDTPPCCLDCMAETT